MGRRVPHHAQGLGVLRREDADLDLARFRQLVVEADDLAIDLGGHRRLGSRGPIAAATSLTGTEPGNSLELPSGRMTLSMGGMSTARIAPAGRRRYKGRPKARRADVKYRGIETCGQRRGSKTKLRCADCNAKWSDVDAEFRLHSDSASDSAPKST